MSLHENDSNSASLNSPSAPAQPSPVMKAADVNAMAAKILGLRAEAIAKRDRIPLVDAYDRAYRETRGLAALENNSRHAKIGSEYRIAEPEATTDPRDVKALAKSLMAEYGCEAEHALRIAKAELPPMQSLAPRSLGDFVLDSDDAEAYPSDEEVAALQEKMFATARAGGKGFDQAAAAYLNAQRRNEAKARTAGGVGR